MNEPTWKNQLIEASLLPDKELSRHARVSIDNRHFCLDCFCCAAAVTLKARQDNISISHASDLLKRRITHAHQTNG